MEQEKVQDMSNTIVLLVHPITGESQQCFPSDNYIYCNFTKRNGKVWRYSKTKDFIKFFAKWRRKRKNQEENFIQKEKEPAVKQSSNSSN